MLQHTAEKLSKKGALVSVEETTDSRLDAKFPVEYTHICTGFGIDEKVPIRLAAYALPVLQASTLQMKARAEWYVAQSFAVELNDLDPDTVSANVSLMKEYIALIKQDLGIQRQTQWLEEKDPFDSERVSLLTEMAKVLREHGSDRLLRFANKRDGQDSLMYIAAHALYMWDDLDIDESLFLTSREETPNSLLMIGGPAEKIFYEARQILKDHMKNSGDRTTHQGFTKIGRLPPYLQINDEWTVQQESLPELNYKALQSISNPDVLRDIQYLIIGLTETLTFDDRSRIKKGKVTPEEIEDIDNACSRLQEILAQLRS